MIQKIFIILTLVFSSVSHAEEKPSPLAPIGFVFSVGPTQWVFEAKGAAPKPGDIVWVVIPQIDGKHKVLMTSIKEEMKLTAEDYPTVYKNLSTTPTSLPIYEINLKEKLDASQVGLGYILTKGSAVIQNNKTLKLTHPDSSIFYLTACFSWEGIHFVLNQEGKPHSIWYQYYPLGYDVGQVQNACTKEDLPKE